jgi:hypothetical protein
LPESGGAAVEFNALLQERPESLGTHAVGIGRGRRQEQGERKVKDSAHGETDGSREVYLQ